jgi:hypothetical protein
VAYHHPSPAHDRGGRQRRQVRNAMWSTWRRRPARRALARTVRLLVGAGRHGPLALLGALPLLPSMLADRRVIAPAVERELRLLEQE